ncbi:MAG: TRAP transporter small permease [Syntrophales bacterium]|nr:TRAP transporter small permease [Syntrophales bacterium]
MSHFHLPLSPPAPNLIRWLGNAVDWTIVVLGFVMVIMVFFNVIMHVVGKDVALTTELCEFMMVWVSFLGGASAARRGLHMTITEFLDKLSSPMRRFADGIIQVFCLVVLGLLVKFGMGIVMANWGNELTVLEWPMALQYLSLPVGSAAMLIFVAFDLVQIVHGKSREERYGG